MAESGYAIDASFAASFLARMSEAPDLLRERGPLAAQSEAAAPLRFSCGRLRMFLRGPKGRYCWSWSGKGSAPGNERNVLKWHAAVSRGAELYLESDSQRVRCTPDAVLLVLAFGRPPKCDRSDFEKTVAFCEQLAEIINRQDLSGRTPLRVLVRKYPPEASDWKECACWTAQQVLAAL